MWALAHRQWTAEEQLRNEIGLNPISLRLVLYLRGRRGIWSTQTLCCPADMLIHFSSGPRHVPTTTPNAIRHRTLLFTKSLPIISTWLSHVHNTTGDETGRQSLLEFLMSAKQRLLDVINNINTTSQGFNWVKKLRHSQWVKLITVKLSIKKMIYCTNV